jgi:hypothetical protein
MTTRSARVLRVSVALLSLTPVGLARAQAPANPGRQLEGQIINDVGSAVTGQPAPVVPGQPGVFPGQPGVVVPGQPGVVPGQPGVVPGQPGYGVPATPRQALQGLERQAINSVTGQPGAMPYQGASGARYQLPPQYAGSAPGTTVSYGGASYVINADRTMSRAALPAANAVRYQLPPQYAGSAPGTTVSYGGANYVVNADRTMSPAAAGVLPPAGLPSAALPAAALPAAVQPSPAATRYLIPAELAGSGPGTTVSYGGASYVINNDNTMSPAAR